MTIKDLETQLTTISQHLKNISVEIAHPHGGGSGVIWRDNLIVTNSHVVRGSVVNVKFEDGSTVKGRVLARDRHLDSAVIEVNAPRLPNPIIGDSHSLRSGEIVLAMGSPWGFTNALTTGVIHSWKKPTIPLIPLINLTQTNPQQNNDRSLIAADIRLAPGNSGGVLANARGEAIGINTAIYWGLALAIPSQLIEDFLKTIDR